MIYGWKPMVVRFARRSPVRPMVAAALAVAGATLVSLVLGRGDTAARSSATVTITDRSGGSRTDRPSTSLASTTASAPTATSDAASPRSVETRGQPVIERDGTYRWLWADPMDIRFLWRDDSGDPYGQLQAARAALEQRGERVVAITNGGIYRPGLVPMGLYVEDGVELTALNRASGSGNFFLQPNGVFWAGGGRAGIETTHAYDAAAVDRMVEIAIQSGPMLVVDSEINGRFSVTSTSTYRRNAAGVDASGRVLLVTADRPVTLWEMATRCRELGAVNALYLDGTLSRLDEAVDGRPIFPNIPVASMIAVVEATGG